MIFPAKMATSERIKQIFLPITSEIDATNIVSIPAINIIRHFALTTLRLSSQTKLSSELILLIS